MPMFRFWASDRGSDQTAVDSHSSVHLAEPQPPSTSPDATATILSSNLQSPKRRRESADDDDVSLTPAAPAKRVKLGLESADDDSDAASVTSPAPDAMDRARDEIRHHFGLEVLLKHDELRLINQELAKCQAALEQLRRCHLIPYPVSCPTPDQMLDISSGKGPAVQSRPGENAPRWAPPFGVADGPYARHYAKWLIPDPAFDGIQPEWSFAPEPVRSRASFAEDRSMRNSFGESGSALKGRPGRSSAGQKLQALSSGYPQPKEKAGPCVLKRADGQTVKLVCLDCHRDNFSSTQGFINHCRIAHKREFKSHEEAAVQSGQPIEAGETPTVATVSEEKAPAPSSRSTAVHPFARPDMSEQEAYQSLSSRISASIKLYRQGKLPGVGMPSVTAPAQAARVKTAKAGKVDVVPETPYLSRLMKSRKFNGNLSDIVADAKTKISLEDITPGEESEDSDMGPMRGDSHDALQVRSPVVMRMPAKSTKSPAPPGAMARPGSSKAHASHISFVSSPDSTEGVGDKDRSRGILSDEDMDMEDANLSPNTLVSNNAPSLVSDDGEYDDSDDGTSVSGGSDSLDADSVSDVAEITLDDDHDPRSMRRGSSGVSGAVKLRKGDAKHVTFVSPVKNASKERKRKA